MQPYLSFGNYTTRTLKKSCCTLTGGGIFNNRLADYDEHSPFTCLNFIFISAVCRNLQKSVANPPERSGSSKNHFSSRRNAPIPSKTVFHPVGTLRRLQKSFSILPECSDSFKNHLSSRRNAPTPSKPVFHETGMFRRAEYSILLTNKFNKYDSSKDCKD
jgi:hypothetical protein